MVAVRKPCPKCGRSTNSGAMKAHIQACGRILTVEYLIEAGNIDTSGAETECWIWRRGKWDPDSYGYYLGKTVHKLMYETVNGPLVSGAVICHTCDVKRCVNPDHIWAGTQSDNVRDAYAKGRAVSPMTRPEVRVNQRKSMQRGDDHWTRRMPEKAQNGVRAMRNRNIALAEKRSDHSNNTF